MKLEFNSKQLTYDLSGNPAKTKVILSNSDGANVPVFLLAEDIDLSNDELLNKALEVIYEENFPNRAENEKFALVDKALATFEEQSVEFASKLKEMQRLFVTAVELTEEQKSEIVAQYPKYEVGVAYKAGVVIAYDGMLYEVVQEHTSQADWKPSEVSSLYKLFLKPTIEVDGETLTVVNDFVQPTGAHDVYKKGDRVTFEGKVYESAIDNNVYSPTAYPAGWTLVE